MSRYDPVLFITLATACVLGIGLGIAFIRHDEVFAVVLALACIGYFARVAVSK